MNELKVEFSHNGSRYRATLELDAGWHFRQGNSTSHWWENYLTQFFKEHKDLNPTELERIDSRGITLKGNTYEHHPSVFQFTNPLQQQAAAKTDLLSKLVWSTLPAIKDGQTLPPIEYIQSVDEAEAPLTVDQMARVEYEFVEEEEPHVLDSLYQGQTPRWSMAKDLPHLPSREDVVLLETAYLTLQSGVEFAPFSDCVAKVKDVKKKKQKERLTIHESIQGVNLSVDPRKNYRMTTTLQDRLRSFYQVDHFVSTEVYGKNSPLNGMQTDSGLIEGSLTSSFNRVADTITLLRKVEDKNGVSDAYAGRMGNLEMAQKMAEFIFIAEIDQYNNLSGQSKGLRETGPNTFELYFAVQSFLNMNEVFEKEQMRMFYDEQTALQELVKGAPLQITHPKTGEIYTVTVKIPPLFATQFNGFNYFEGFFPDTSGKTAADKETARGDDSLRAYALDEIRALKQLEREKLAEIEAARREVPVEEDRADHDQLLQDFENQRQRLIDKIKQIKDSLEILSDGSLKEPWQYIMTRAFLCRLIDLPLVIHCKSSCDRTGGVAIPMVVAMNEWLDSNIGGQGALDSQNFLKYPKDAKGRYRIVDIVGYQHHTVENGKRVECEPFKELFLYKMLHELKSSELSRGPKGLKVREQGLLNPALKDLMPKRCLKSRVFLPTTLAEDKQNGRHLLDGDDTLYRVTNL